MPWPPEMEVIDQLLGGALPLPVICRLFVDDASAKRTLARYVAAGVIVLSEQESPLPTWRAEQFLRGEKPLAHCEHLHASLTEKGAKAFEEGTWDRL